MKCSNPWQRLVQTPETRRVFKSVLSVVPNSEDDYSKLCGVDFQKDPLMIQLDLFETLQRYLPEISRFEWISCPCGSCAACKQSNAQVWADRLLMELPYVSAPSSFVTLTYDDAHVPISYTLSPWSDRVEYCHPIKVRDFQLFMKRLRRYIKDPGLRFLASAEYGGRFHRPHFHVALIGYTPPDLTFYKRDHGHDYFNSEVLSSIWQQGFTVTTALTPGSGAYVARYMTEKWDGRDYRLYSFEAASRGLDPLPKQRLIMSRRPGLGRRYLEENRDAVLRDDLIVPCRGSAGARTVPAFRYALSTIDEMDVEALKDRRAIRAERPPETDQTLVEQAADLAARLRRRAKSRNAF